MNNFIHKIYELIEVLGGPKHNPYLRAGEEIRLISVISCCKNP